MAEKSKDKDAKAKAASETEKVKQQRDEYLDGWKRAKADLINYKKDELKRLEQIVQFATEDMMRDLIAVLDSFELALTSMQEKSPEGKGIYLIKSKLEDILERRGLTKITVKEGDVFDPAYHEAVSVTERTNGAEEGTVAEQLETGYALHGKVLRAARVKVFK